MSDRRITVITGASSGIGLAAAKLFSEKGDKVYCFSRRPCPENGVISISCDITDEASVNNAVEKVVSEAGRIDVFICNAGYGISGAVEFTDIETAKKQFDVNFWGAMRCIRAVLPYMRKNSAGHIIVTSSVAGAIGIPFQAYYSATKASLNSIVLAVGNEVRSYGIKLCAVMPGDIKTGFTSARNKINEGAESYSSLAKSVASMEHDEQNGMPPIAIAKKFYSLSVKKNPKPLCSVGLMYKACCMLINLLPCRLANWIVGKMYAS